MAQNQQNNNNSGCLSFFLFTIALVIALQYFDVEKNEFLAFLSHFFSGEKQEKVDRFKNIAPKQCLYKHLTDVGVITSQKRDSVDVLQGLKITLSLSPLGDYRPARFYQSKSEIFQHHLKVNKGDQLVFVHLAEEDFKIQELDLSRAERLNGIARKIKVTVPINAYQKVELITKDSVGYSDWKEDNAKFVFTAIQNTNLEFPNYLCEDMTFIPGGYIKHIIPSRDTLFAYVGDNYTHHEVVWAK